MTRVIAIAGHAVLLAFVVIGVLIGAGAALGNLTKVVQLFLLVGCIGSIVVLVRRGGPGRTAVLIFNIVLMLFALLSLAGLVYYELRYGGQPLFAGLIATGFIAVPPLLSLLDLKRRRSTPAT